MVSRRRSFVKKDRPGSGFCKCFSHQVVACTCIGTSIYQKDNKYFLLLGCKEVKQRKTESSEKEIDWKCLLLPFSVCGSKKKQKIMYKSAKNAGEL